MFGLKRLDKFNVEFSGPQNVSGVSIFPSGFLYRFSDLHHIRYLDLADRRVFIREFTPLFEGPPSEPNYLTNRVELEFRHRTLATNNFLFTVYKARTENFSDNIQVEAVFKYLKVYNILQMHRLSELSRHTAMVLFQSLYHHNIHNELLVKTIMESLFIRTSTACYMITFPTLSGSFIRLTETFEKSFVASLLSETFETHNLCPILGSIFSRNYNFLRKLLYLHVKKKEFLYILMPFHDILMNTPLYAAFQPISDSGKVWLDSDAFTVRDHLLFEIIAVLSLELWNVINTDIIRGALRFVNKTLTYPHISVMEMKTRLLNIDPGLSDNHIKLATDAYQRLFPNTTMETCPRSLRDLCRCTIRDSLNRDFLVPHGLRSLPLPKKIISFLNIEDV